MEKTQNLNCRDQVQLENGNQTLNLPKGEKLTRIHLEADVMTYKTQPLGLDTPQSRTYDFIIPSSTNLIVEKITIVESK